MNQRSLEMLTLGFGTTVAMWAVGYFARLPAVMLPSRIILLLLLACAFICGSVAGLRSATPLRTGALGGLVTGLLNLLVLGSVLTGPGAAIWVPGSILLSALLVLAGAWSGSLFRGSVPAESPVGPSTFVWVTAGATLPSSSNAK